MKLIDSQEVLVETTEVQASTLEALERIQVNLTEAQLVGCETQPRLEEQREQIAHIQQDAVRVQSGLKKSNQLFNKLGLIGFRFRTERAARKEIQKTKTKSRHDAAREDYSKPTTEADSKTNEEVKQPKQRASKKIKGKKSSKIAEPHCKPLKSLLEEIGDIEGNEHRDQLQHIADTDQEINQHLKCIDSQLDDLLDLSRSMKDQVRAQTHCVGGIQEQMDQTCHEQKVVNHRTRRFLDGKLRNTYNIQDTILSAGRDMGNSDI